MSDQLAPLPLPQGLTSDEVNFVYNVEVLGLPARKAAQLAGMPIGKICAAHIVQAREITKRELRGVLQITKEDVVHGIRDAVYRAQLLGEPMTEIVGWEKIAKLLGYDAPARVDINVNASVQVLKEHVREMADTELVAALGAGNVIDGDFYVVRRDS